MRTKHVIVVPYDEIWEEEFNKIKKEIEHCLGDLISDIEHVGSTSVKGLSAKPIIDLDVIIQNYDCFDKVVEKLSEIGYIYEGDLGIEDRHAFKYTGKVYLMTHHLYVCPKGSRELKRHLTFRNYLRTHAEDVEKYSKIKEEAAKLYPEDIDSYCEYKAPVINEIYHKIGLE